VIQRPTAVISIDIAIQKITTPRSISSICICIAYFVPKSSCPFSADSCLKRAALEGAPLAGKASGAIASELPPVGNTGGSFRSVPNV
jgi:hypothetical protein